MFVPHTASPKKKKIKKALIALNYILIVINQLIETLLFYQFCDIGTFDKALYIHLYSIRYQFINKTGIVLSLLILVKL